MPNQSMMSWQGLWSFKLFVKFIQNFTRKPQPSDHTVHDHNACSHAATTLLSFLCKMATPPSLLCCKQSLTKYSDVILM